MQSCLRLFEEMRAGQHPEGSYTLRLKIDMASPIISMRDPVIYRIKSVSPHIPQNVSHTRYWHEKEISVVYRLTQNF